MIFSYIWLSGALAKVLLLCTRRSVILNPCEIPTIYTSLYTLAFSFFFTFVTPIINGLRFPTIFDFSTKTWIIISYQTCKRMNTWIKYQKYKINMDLNFIIIPIINFILLDLICSRSWLRSWILLPMFKNHASYYHMIRYWMEMIFI